MHRSQMAWGIGPHLEDKFISEQVGIRCEVKVISGKFILGNFMQAVARRPPMTWEVDFHFEWQVILGASSSG